jgi:hypothetical protein
VRHKLEELLDQYLKATGLEKETGFFFVFGLYSKDRQVITPAARAH